MHSSGSRYRRKRRVCIISLAARYKFVALYVYGLGGICFDRVPGICHKLKPLSKCQGCHYFACGFSDFISCAMGCDCSLSSFYLSGPLVDDLWNEHDAGHGSLDNRWRSLRCTASEALIPTFHKCRHLRKCARELNDWCVRKNCRHESTHRSVCSSIGCRLFLRSSCRKSPFQA